MLNDVYERLRNLLEDIGLAFNDGGITKAEILAYSTGIKMVQDSIEHNINCVMTEVDDKDELENYCRMLSVNADNYSTESLKRHIKSRMSERYSLFTADEFNTAFNEVGGSYSMHDGILSFSGIAFDSLTKLGEFIQGYVPFCVHVVLSGSGMTFDQWDNAAKCWEEYDKMRIPFDIIDKLGGSSI